MHKAIIAPIRVTPHPDPEVLRLAVGTVCNETVIVSKETQDGALGIYFPCDLQLSEKFATVNNLVRKKDPITGKNIGGLFEEKRRVRVQKIRNVRSYGFWAPLSYLDKLGGDISSLKEGDQIDTWNGVSICNKYITPRIRQSGVHKNKKIKKNQNEYVFPQHRDTEQFRYHTNNFNVGDEIVVTLKLHGTSQRVAKNIVIRPLRWWEKIINKIIKIDNKSIEILNGTRRVILNNNPLHKSGFHPDTLRDEAAARITPYLEDYMHVYFEVVGWESYDSTIMPSASMSKVIDTEAKAMYPNKIEYTYGCPKGTFDIYVYRISYVLPNGKEIDMLWQDVKSWCTHHGIKHVPEIDVFKYDGNKDNLVNKIEALAEGKDPINPLQPKEGVCVRINSNYWKCFKEKQFLFKVLEGIAKESDDYTDPEEEAAQQA